MLTLIFIDSSSGIMEVLVLFTGCFFKCFFFFVRIRCNLFIFLDFPDSSVLILLLLKFLIFGVDGADEYFRLIDRLSLTFEPEEVD